MAEAQDKSFHCLLITPEAVLADCQASFVVLPAHDGQIGIAHNRAPLICRLGIGPLRIDAADGGGSYFVDGGFARMRANELVILVPRALRADQIDRAAAEQALQEAQAMPITDQASLQARAAALARARTQLALLSQLRPD